MKFPQFLIASTLFLTTAESARAFSMKWSAAVGGNDNLYEAVLRPDGLTWDAAKLEAELAGGHLVTITSAAENDFVHRLIFDKPEFWVAGDRIGNNSLGPWIGAFQPPNTTEPNGGWSWVTGEEFNFTNWSPGEPNEHFIDIEEDVAHFFGIGSANFAKTWNDLPADFTLLRAENPRGYIIEYEAAPVPEPNSLLGLLTFGILGSGLGVRKKA